MAPHHGLPPLQAAGPVFRPGIGVACTPGQVVHRNHLIELIQYTPMTPRVQHEPVFIVPLWIIKFYIPDLSPHDSLVRQLVAQGHTVFMLSWRNPDGGDALLDMPDCVQRAVLDPLAQGDVRLPIFAMGTVKDPVTPWRSAFKVQRLVHADTRFVLTSGGHNAGIVSEPGHAGRSQPLMTNHVSDPQLAPEDWQRQAPHVEGSWWPAWFAWLVAHGHGTVPVHRVHAAATLGPAPGSCVQVRGGD